MFMILFDSFCILKNVIINAFDAECNKIFSYHFFATKRLHVYEKKSTMLRSKEIVKHMKKILSAVNIIWFLENLLITEYCIEDRMTYPTVAPTTTTKGRKSVPSYCSCVCLVLFFLIPTRKYACSFTHWCLFKTLHRT